MAPTAKAKVDDLAELLEPLALQKQFKEFYNWTSRDKKHRYVCIPLLAVPLEQLPGGSHTTRGATVPATEADYQELRERVAEFQSELSRHPSLPRYLEIIEQAGVEIDFAERKDTLGYSLLLKATDNAVRGLYPPRAA